VPDSEAIIACVGITVSVDEPAGGR